MHKNACRERAKELFDQKLFAQPPKREDCPICMLMMPFEYNEIYMVCCGKTICCGCISSLPRGICPFCNTPVPQNNEEHQKRLLERINKYNDPEAMNSLGNFYYLGQIGLPVDHSKAVELYRRASELDLAEGHSNLGDAYDDGLGVEMEKKKAIHHRQIASMMGNVNDRCHLAYDEADNGNVDRAARHWMIAAKCGHDESLELVKGLFRRGAVTKDDFESTLRAHQASQDEIKSEQRDRANKAIQSTLLSDKDEKV